MRNRIDNLKLLISQIPPLDLKFKHGVLTEYELLVATIEKLNEVVDLSNLTREEFLTIKEWIDSQLEGYSTEQLESWRDDGTLESILGSTFDSKVDFETYNQFKALINQDILNIGTQLEQKANNGNVVYVEDFKSLETDVDDTERIKRAVEYAETNGHQTVKFAEKLYTITDTITLSLDDIKLIGEKGTRIKITGNKNAITVMGERNTIQQLEIFSDGIEFGNGFYGVNVMGDSCRVTDCYFHDMSYTAVFLKASKCTVENCTAEDVGWDCVSNYGENTKYNKIINCKAIRTGRHGFSTDAGTKFIEFIDCYSEDVGNPNLAEGHSSYHFEFSDYGKVINCTSRYTANHPICQTENTGSQIPGVRNEGSKDVIVDGLEVVFDSDFSPIKFEDHFWLQVDAGELTKISNSRFINHTDSVISNCYIGGSTVEIFNSVFNGLFTITQGGVSGVISKMEHLSVYGDKSLSFYQSKWSQVPITISDCVFENVEYAIKGHLVGSNIKNNLFKNSFGSIYFDQYQGNASVKSTNNRMVGNTLENLNEGITLGWDGKNGLIQDNTFKGHMDIVLKGTAGGQKVDWKNNIKDSSLTYTTLTDVIHVTIDDDLISKEEKSVQIPLYSGGTGSYLWTDSNGLLRYKNTQPTSDNDGTVIGTL